MSDDLIRVILADDHAVVRAGLKAVLGTAKDMLVVGEASSPPATIRSNSSLSRAPSPGSRDAGGRR